jgi:uncharacterized protein
MRNEGAAGRRRRVLAAVLLALGAYFTLESLLPPERQPSAALCVGLIRGYQAVGSPAMAASGVRCRYTPTCSHYAAAAFDHYGTMEGLVRTAGRLWRCSPWGGAGYDPAVASLSRTPIQEAMPSERQDRRIRQDKITDEELKQAGKAAGACAAGCILSIAASAVTFAVWIIAIIYIVKDSKSRGDPNAVLWLILAVVFPFVGIIVYFVARPKGQLVPCASCKNRRLEILTKCPHCGVDAAGGIKGS